jgi:hypothetical protein
MPVTTIRDFMYLDFQRLRSFASQLLDEGLPSTLTTSDTKGAEFGGELKGRIPLLIEGGANTKGVMSATSTMTSELHHRLVTRVLDGLRAEEMLWPETELDEAPDGAFVSLRAQVQISDPDSLRSLVEKMPDLSRLIAQASGEPAPPPRSRADRRAGRGLPEAESEGVSRAQAEGISSLLATFTPGTVRLRLVRDGIPIATAVVERDKFVEDLDRLVRRHGFLTGSLWETLGQVNAPPDPNLFAPTGSTILDTIERDMLGPLSSIGAVTGAGTQEETSITPLAIYRVIEPRGMPESA